MTSDFLSKLQTQAKQQSEIHQQRIIPAQFDTLTSFIAKYPWQVIGVLALLGALVWGEF